MAYPFKKGVGADLNIGSETGIEAEKDYAPPPLSREEKLSEIIRRVWIMLGAEVHDSATAYLDEKMRELEIDRD